VSTTDLEHRLDSAEALLDRTRKKLEETEEKLTIAEARLAFLQICAHREPASWGYWPASWRISFFLDGDDSAKDLMPRDFLEALDKCRNPPPKIVTQII